MLPSQATAIIRDSGEGKGLPGWGAAVSVADFADRYGQRGQAPVYVVRDTLTSYSPRSIKVRLELLTADPGGLQVYPCRVNVIYPTPIPKANRNLKYRLSDTSPEARAYFKPMDQTYRPPSPDDPEWQATLNREADERERAAAKRQREYEDAR